MKKVATNFLVEVNGVLLADATVSVADQLEVNLVSVAGRDDALLAVTAFLPSARKADRYVHSKNATVAAGDTVSIRLKALPDQKSTSIVLPQGVGDGSETNDGMTCSFCGKANAEVRKMVAGPKAFICDQCIELCHEIVHEA